ncbi:hypothetical protein VTN00DRAFT_9035 [Thermoascus crustaceus]|uniref:uncharacterized protein n=1 Tax=Thermoascus crustaceus TaxID=5088 RepID=UPI0037427474
MNVLNKAVYYPSKAYPGAWNDLDMLQVGNGGLSDTESIAHMSLWAALKSPLLMTNVLSRIDPPTLSILQNPAVLAVSQDPLGSAATRRWRYHVEGGGEIQMYTGSLSGGDQLVLLLNNSPKETTMNASLIDIFWDEGPSGTAAQVQRSWDVYDLWANRMSNAQAAAIINGTALSDSRYNMTAKGGARHVYAQVPPSESKELMGERVGTVQARGTVVARVPAHGVAMFRLRERARKDEL